MIRVRVRVGRPNSSGLRIQEWTTSLNIAVLVLAPPGRPKKRPFPPFFRRKKLKLMEGSTLKCKRKAVLIRVFSGGMAGVQVQPFITAISATLADHRAHINIMVEYLSTSQLRSEHMTPNDLVDWLLASDIHYFLSHAHQSIVAWDCREITDAYWRLVGHNGFPSGLGLFCNIFLQNKYGYLDCMGDFCNKSVKVNLPFDTLNRDEVEAIIAKLPSEGKGIVVKTPFTTNCEFFKICHNIEQVCSGIISLTRTHCLFFVDLLG